jgi:zinc protease
MITRFEVDGVPALFSPKSGPMQAGLVFRVGFADEPLPKRGITHLLEHLALHSTGMADYHYNGATGVANTIFLMQGSESDIVGFLNGVCASLLEPPSHRLTVEKEILRTEASSRRAGVNERMAMWRHGARDYGLTSYSEWGLHGITPEDLHAWVARYFVRQNCVLWVAGSEVPAGLKLTLPDGVRQPAPAPSSTLPVKPAYFPGSSGALVWDSVVRRETASEVFAAVLERVMFRSLRQEAGLSYTVQTDYQPRDDGSAVITAIADALPDKRGAVLGGFVDVLAAMRVGRIDPADVRTVLNQHVSALEQAEEQGDRLPVLAFKLLGGWPLQSLEEELAETRGVTHADVVRVAAAAYADGLLMTPDDSAAEWAGYVAAPTASEHAVTGQSYPSLEHPATRLIIGEEGISIAEDDQVGTVRFDACAAMLAWPDGARQFFGTDGVSVSAEPTMYHGLPAAIAWLDSRVPPGLRCEMPPRAAARIPRPRPATRPGSTPPGPAVPAAPPTGGRAGPIVAIVLLSPLVLVGLLFVLIGATELADPNDRGAAIVALVLYLMVTGGAATGVGFAIRRLRRR